MLNQNAKCKFHLRNMKDLQNEDRYYSTDYVKINSSTKQNTGHVQHDKEFEQ